MINQIPGVEYRFANPGLLEEALTHSSAGSRNYERLEFLGDSVLDLVISHHLLTLYPNAPEGDLSRMRSRLVRADSLKDVATQLKLGEHVHLGSSERKSGGRRRASILGDVLESVFGAIYLDSGYESCQRVILQLFEPLIAALPDVEHLKDPKTRLQEFLQARARPLPVYTLVDESGADHNKTFMVRCALEEGNAASTAAGSSRRKAEQAAAANILEQLLMQGSKA